MPIFKKHSLIENYDYSIIRLSGKLPLVRYQQIVNYDPKLFNKIGVGSISSVHCNTCPNLLTSFGIPM